MWLALSSMAGTSLALMLIQSASVLAAEPGNAAANPVFAALKVEEHRLRWGDLVIGMTLPQVENVLRSKIAFKDGEVEPNPCGISDHVRYRGRKLLIDFAGEDGKETLIGILVPFTGPERTLQRRDLVAALKKRIPGVIYQPSRHEPDVKESDNPRPIYLLKDNPQMAIFLNSGRSIYVGFEECLD
jgi:hypothetical protein